MEERHKTLNAIHNPLSIIALFVLLIEAIAVIAMANNNLTESQRYWFVVFCTIFPLIVFAAFFVITWCHPEKLYGPKDYSDESIFLKLMKQEKLVEEIDGVINDASESKESESRMSIASKVMRSEQLVIEELKKEFHSPILEEVSSNDYLFDAVIKRGKTMVYVETKYVSHGFLTSTALGQIKQFSQAAGFSAKILAIVTPEVLDDTKKERYTNKIAEIDKNIELRFYKL